MGKAWFVSLGVHALLLSLTFLGYRSLRFAEDRRLAGLVETKFKDNPEDAEGVFLFEEPRPSRAAPPVVPKVVEPPVVEAPKLEPVETFPTKPSEVSSPSPTLAPAPAPVPAAPVSANSGKGSPLHPSLNAGMSVVYVLDCSASMGRNSKQKEAIAALSASLDRLTPEVEFQVVLYHSFAEKLLINGTTGLVSATAENKLAARNELMKLTAEGTSKHVEGLKKALVMNPSAIFLLTDADDLTEEQLVTIGLLNRSGTVIYPILFGDKDRLTRSPMLDRLARASRGRVIGRE